MGHSAKFWGRWLAVLPAALLSVLVVNFPIHWLVLIVTSGSDSGGGFGISSLPPASLERLAVALFGPLAYVVVGAKVAPTYKLQTAIVLVVLLAIVLSASSTYVASNNRFGYEGWGWLEFVAVVALWIGGTLAGVYYVNEDLKPRQRRTTTGFARPGEVEADSAPTQGAIDQLRKVLEFEQQRNASPVDSLRRVLELERQKKFTDDAIVGGLDKYFQRFVQDHDLSTSHPVSLVLQTLPPGGYRALHPIQRRRVVEELLSVTKTE